VIGNVLRNKNIDKLHN